VWHAFSPVLPKSPDFGRPLCGKRASEHRIQIENEIQREKISPRVTLRTSRDKQL
jgi:hypothetical protein